MGKEHNINQVARGNQEIIKPNLTAQEKSKAQFPEELGEIDFESDDMYMSTGSWAEMTEFLVEDTEDDTLQFANLCHSEVTSTDGNDTKNMTSKANEDEEVKKEEEEEEEEDGEATSDKTNRGKNNDEDDDDHKGHG